MQCNGSHVLIQCHNNEMKNPLLLITNEFTKTSNKAMLQSSTPASFISQRISTDAGLGRIGHQHCFLSCLCSIWQPSSSFFRLNTQELAVTFVSVDASLGRLLPPFLRLTPRVNISVVSVVDALLGIPV